MGIKNPTLSRTLLKNPTLSGTEMCQNGTLAALCILQPMGVDPPPSPGLSTMLLTSECIFLSHLSVAEEDLCLIDMSSNNITRIHSILNHKASLKSISFHNNSIQFINQRAFSPFPNLTALYLGNNQLEVVEYETFHTLREMEYLHLYQNRYL